MDDEKEIDRYYEKQEKSNPILTYRPDDSLGLKKQFEKFAFIKADELLLKKFKYSSKTKFHFTDSLGKQIDIRFDFMPGRIGGHKIIAYSGKDSFETKIPGIMQDLKYAFLDVFPGGNKEIVVLSEYYIMLGYNFDLLVYEIKAGE